MKRILLALFAVAVVAGVVAGRAQTSPRIEAGPAPLSGKEVRGASPYIEIKNEPAPNLQQLEVVIAGNAEQVPNTGLLKTAKQEVAERHPWGCGAGHRSHLFLLVVATQRSWTVLGERLDQTPPDPARLERLVRRARNRGKVASYLA